MLLGTRALELCICAESSWAGLGHPGGANPKGPTALSSRDTEPLQEPPCPPECMQSGLSKRVLAGPRCGAPHLSKEETAPPSSHHARPYHQRAPRQPLPHWAAVLLSGSLGPAPLHSPELLAGLTSILSHWGCREDRDRGPTGTARGGLLGPQRMHGK